MKILHLYHDIMNLYGEYANISALERFIEKNAGICQTDRCSFDKKAELADYDFIYVGSGTERNQKLVMEDMKKYKSELENAINSGKVILMTGNSFEMLGKTVTDPEGTAYEGLGIFDFETTEQNKTRITADAVFTSDFSDKKLVGFINKCSSIKNISSPLFSILMGIGNNEAEKTEGINVHIYGAHIFHTNNKQVWDYVNRFSVFNRFTNSPVANYHGELYSLPFNMYTFNKMWGVVTPEEAAAKIEEQKKEAGITEPKNLEEQAISLVGTDIYEKLIKGYTQKQWGRPCTELPAFIIKRLPVRLTFDNNYFNALYQGIPVGGYTKMVENMLKGIEVQLNVDYLADKAKWDGVAEKVIYTGPIDAYFDYCLGNLEYRSVRFETEVLDKPNFQGNAAVNYTDAETPWTRIIEHKWFEFGKDENGNDLPKTVISREYSSEWKLGDEPYYPVNDEKNGNLYQEYKKLAEKEKNVVFGGRLGEYKYYDMDQVIAAALGKAKEIVTP